MTQRAVAWSIWAASIGLAIAWTVVDSLVQASQGGVGEYVFIAGAIALYATVGALITSRQLGNRIGLIFTWVAFAAAVGGLCGSYAMLAVERDLPFVAAATWVANISVVAILGPIAFLFLLYPTGRPPTRRWTWVANVMVTAYVITILLFAVTPGIMRAGFASIEGHILNPIGLPFAWKGAIEAVTTAFGSIVFLGAIVSVLSLIQRYRGAEATERQQIRWLALLGGVTATWLVVMFALEAAGALPEEGPAADAPFFVLIFLIFLGIPITCGMAILRHGLWDLDVVVKKTLQYGVLAALFAALAALLVAAVPVLFVGVGSDVVPILIAAAVLSIGFRLIWAPARRLADRIVYGRRATPYEVLSEFAERVGGTYSTDDVLPRMAQLLGEATGARAARVWLRIGDVMRVEASWPTDAPTLPETAVGAEALPDLGADRSFEVRHQGELLGALTVTEAPDDPITPSKERLARDMAAQAGLVLRNVRLIEDLRRSRRRIVTAQDERAKKLERDIHDGAQQQLVALQVKQRLADAMIERDPAKAHALLDEIQRDTAAALEDLRDLARGIYPPLLADQGLAAALGAQARKAPIPVEVRPDGVERYPQEIEAAVYFSCLEALQNVAKYAEATSAEVRLADDHGVLTFEVEDDGVGFDPDGAPRGTGLQGIADRLAALGGELTIRSAPGSGATVAGRLPVGPPEVGS